MCLFKRTRNCFRLISWSNTFVSFWRLTIVESYNASRFWLGIYSTVVKDCSIHICDGITTEKPVTTSDETTVPAITSPVSIHVNVYKQTTVASCSLLSWKLYLNSLEPDQTPSYGKGFTIMISRLKVKVTCNSFGRATFSYSEIKSHFDINVL